MQPTEPATSAVRAALERILDSETFSRSQRARELLAYLVGCHLRGEADRLKGTTIAIDVFGRDAGFDPASDSVVRVQAGRLRTLLEQYYRSEGAAEALRIAVPRGSYGPVIEFDGRAAEPAGRGEPPRAWSVATMRGVSAGGPSARHAALARVGWLAVGFAFALAWIGTTGVRTAETDGRTALAGQPVAASATTPQAALGLPSVFVAVEGAEPNPQRVAAALRAELSGYDTVDLLAGPEEPGSGARDLRYGLVVSPGFKPGDVRAELQHVATGKVVHAQVLPRPDAEAPDLEDRLASLVASTAEVSGALYGHIDRAVLAPGSVASCLLDSSTFRVSFGAAAHARAYRCFEAVLAAGERSPVVLAELAFLHSEAVMVGSPYPANATAKAALALAKEAVKTAPTSAFAQKALGYVQIRLGEVDGAVLSMRRAHELQPHNPGVVIAYAYALVFAGDYDGASVALSRIPAEIYDQPGLLHYVRFLARFGAGDIDGVRSAAAALAADDGPQFLVARLIAAHASGETDRATKLLERLQATSSDLARNPRSVFERRSYPRELTERLVSTLTAAGLPSGGVRTKAAAAGLTMSLC